MQLYSKSEKSHAISGPHIANSSGFEQEIEFIRLLKANQFSIPNDFTNGIGNLIKSSREEKGISQAELTKQLSRRQATISDIENGKPEIGILTLVQFAVVLEKPIAYFFPESLLRDYLVEVKSNFQRKLLEIAREVEYYGDRKLVLNVLNVLLENFQEDMDASQRGFTPDLEDEEFG